MLVQGDCFTFCDKTLEDLICGSMSEDDLPAWAWSLSLRVRRALLNELHYGKLRDLSKYEVRRYGREGWMRVPGVGRASVAEICEAIGGWDADEEVWPKRTHS